MPVLVFVLAVFVLLNWGWPWRLKFKIRRTGKSGETPRELIFWVGLLITLGWLVLYKTSEASLLEAEPAVTTLVILGALLLGYGRFYPPVFFPAYQRVTDIQDGHFDIAKLEALSYPKGTMIPVFLVVYNVGIAPWGNYRITVEFPEQFLIYRESPEIPASKGWLWKTQQFAQFSEYRPALLQVQGQNTLAVGEPHAIRFVTRTPIETGTYTIGLRVVADGRLGEAKRSLRIQVT
ncbi:MAG: hypothetical protein HY535_04745 [Chloroflexi bacterium]|nr:hypothetical protein [Chloroflexota bacterium]